MPKLFEDAASEKPPVLPLPELLEPITDVEVLEICSDVPLPLTRTGARIAPVASSTKLDKNAIRCSLKASVFDGVFSTIFSCITADVLLSNFLLELGANSVEIGLLSAIAMIANFLQPIGAFLADRATSRRWYSLWLFAPSRLLWLVLALGIGCFGARLTDSHQLVLWTLGIVLLTHVLGALGSPSWVSWMAVLVPHRLRGRYFGLRNSAASLTNLLCVPLLGLVVSKWGGGSIQGYGVVLVVGVLAGLISLGFQSFMTDVNPQASAGKIATSPNSAEESQPLATVNLFKDKNFLIFLLYYGLWMFAVSLSAPFFSVYMLKDLNLDVSWVTLYSSMTAGANLLMLIGWGKLADRIGNRPVLVLVGILFAVMPLLWLGTSNDSISLLVWLPLLHLLLGGTWSALDLCNNNIQMAIAPARQPSSYFAIAAAVSGLCGALGTMTGGIFAQYAHLGGLPGLFALSAVLRLVALLPLVFVREPRSQSLETLLSESLPRLAGKTPKLNIIRAWNR